MEAVLITYSSSDFGGTNLVGSEHAYSDGATGQQANAVVY
jgi:hypothetical protein